MMNMKNNLQKKQKKIFLLYIFPAFIFSLVLILVFIYFQKKDLSENQKKSPLEYELNNSYLENTYESQIYFDPHVLEDNSHIEAEINTLSLGLENDSFFFDVEEGFPMEPIQKRSTLPLQSKTSLPQEDFLLPKDHVDFSYVKPSIFHSKEFLSFLLFVGLFFAAFAIIAYLLARSIIAPLRESRDNQKRFSDDISHELRTPLSVLRSHIDLAYRKNPNHETKEFLGKINPVVSHMEKMISSLLAFARIKNSDDFYNRKKINMGKKISHTLEQFWPILQEKGIVLENNSGDFFVSVQEQLIGQLLYILFDNAITHNADIKLPYIKIDIRELEGRKILLIRNSSKNKKEVLFKRGDKGSDAGLGLGLSLAKEICDIHDFSISLRHHPDLDESCVVIEI